MNIHVKRLIIKKPRSIKRYLPEQYTPDNYHTMLRPGITLLVDLDGSVSLTIDYGKLVDDHPKTRRKDWKSFCEALTTQLLDGYSISDHFYKGSSCNLSKPVIYASCDSAEYNIEYAQASSETVGIFASRHMCHDLKITLPEHVDRSRVLMCVNGYLCYTLPSKSEPAVYAYTAADFVANTETTPTVTYLDFSKVGPVVCHHLGYTSLNTKVVLDNNINKHELHEYSDFTVVVNPKYDLNQHTVILVLNHHVVLPDEYTVTGNNTIKVDLRKLTLDRSTLNILRMKDITLDKEGYLCKGDSYTTLQEHLEKGNSPDTFAVVIEGKVCVDRMPATRGFATSITEEEGMLLDKTSGSILGEVVVKYGGNLQHHLNPKKNEYYDKDVVATYATQEKEFNKKPDYLSRSPLDLIKLGGL